jgi:alpha-tubulin suppressor-like RCC1 family protein
VLRVSRAAAHVLLVVALTAFSGPLAQLAQTASDRDIAFGARHAIAMRNNGEVVTWGNNVGCQLGRRGGNRAAEPALVMRNARQIAAAGEHNLVLSRDGKVYAWGMNAQGWLGVGNEFDQCEGPVLVTSLEGKSIVAIATGNNFSVALTSSGEIYCAGDNSMGQCPRARGAAEDVFTLAQLPGLTGTIVAVKAGGFHTLALTSDGRLFAFGRGRDGQLGNGRVVNGAGMVEQLDDVVSFAAGIWHSAAVRRDGSVWLWGNNAKSQLCDGRTTSRSVPGSVTMASKVTRVTAGGHGTILQTADGALYACGDNQFGSLGLDKPLVVTEPTRVTAPSSTDAVVVAGGNHSAFSPDGCAVRLTGDNSEGVISATGAASTTRTFTARANLSLCGARPAAPLPDIVNPAPKGGASGCWAPRKDEDAAASPKFAGLRQAMIAAEGLLRKNEAFMAALEPVRMKTSMSAGPSDDGGSRMHVKVVPERKIDGTRVWAGECDVIPQLDRIGGAIFQVSIFFNEDARSQFIGANGSGPKLTGRAGGYPEYNGWVLLTKDGRLPWIPQTLADKLDAEKTKRERALADWKKNIAGMTAMDEAAAQKTYEMLKKTDAAGAEKFLATTREQARELSRLQRDVYPLTTASLEKQLRDLESYRASFTPEQLRAPAVWGDPTGEDKRRHDARMAQLRALPPEVQKEADTLSKAGKVADARAVRQRHMERASLLMADAIAEYELTNLKPGDADRAISVKPDPAFPDRRDPNRVQMIAVMFSLDPNARNTERRAWQQKVKETFDYPALAVLLR